MAYNRIVMGRIEPGELKIGIPVPYSAYDEHHQLLLREGVILTNQRQLDALVARGLYRVERVASAYESLDTGGRPLEAFDHICRELNSLLAANDLGGDGFAARILNLAARLGRLAEHHPEACLAAILHDIESRYAVRHMVHVAVVARLLAGLLQLGESDRLSLVAAALTMNLSVLELQNELNALSRRELSEPERVQMRAHPEATVERLLALGVADQTWLDIVAQHHEAFDGSGYPRGLSGEAILVGARVLALVDAYTARLRQRADRHASLPNDSLREIFINRGSHFDPAMTPVLVRAVGIFPPGLVVELENGEVGIVIRLGMQAHAPEVQVMVSSRSTLLPQPLTRATDAAPYRIRQALLPGAGRYRFDPLQFWRR